MSGPGSTTVAYALEDGDYLSGPPASPTYILPGEDIQFDDSIDIQNQLTNISAPDSTLPKRKLLGNFEGGFGASWTLDTVSPQPWHDHVFTRDSDASGTNDAFDGDGSVPSAEWYVAVTQPDGSVVERVLEGVVVTSVSIEWRVGEPARASVTCLYGNENKNTSVTAGTISRPSGSTPSHAGDLTVGGTTQAKIESATLTVDNIVQLQRGADSRFPVDAVEGAPRPSLDVSGTFTEDDQLVAAYQGPGTGATSPATETLDPTSATLSFAVGGTTVGSYTIDGKADTAGWDQIPPGEGESVQESLTLPGTDLTAEA